MLKKIFGSLLIILNLTITFSTVAFAKSIISTVTATSPDIDSIPSTANSVTTLPSITVTSGSPAFIDISQWSDYWEVKDGNNWVQVTEGNFIDGKTYRFATHVSVESASYTFNENLSVSLNGDPMTVENVITWDAEEYGWDAAVADIYSKPYTVVSRDAVSSIELTSINLNYIPQIKNKFSKKPEIIVEAGYPAYTNDSYMHWERFNGYGWDYTNINDNFIEGDTYRLAVTLLISNDTESGSPSNTANNNYVLHENNLVVTLNGEPMTIRDIDIEENYSSVYAYSKSFVAAESIPRQVISSITATSPDIDEIVSIDNSVTTKPSLTITGGWPAYFSLDESKSCWEYQNGDSWNYLTTGNFYGGGTYRYRTLISIDGNIGDGSPSAVAAEIYELDENLSITLNGQPMTYKTDAVSVAEARSMVYVYSQTYTCYDPDSREKVSVIHAYSDDFNGIPKTTNTTDMLPTITMAEGCPAHFLQDSMYWQIQDGDDWSYADDGNFINGEVYRLSSVIWIDNDTENGSPSSTAGNDYVLDKDDLTVIFCGNPMTLGEVYSNANSSCVNAYSIPFKVSSRENVSYIEITSSNISTLPNVNNSVSQRPELNKVSNDPSYFYFDNSYGSWQKFTGDYWVKVSNGNFVEGQTYRYTFLVVIDNETSDGSPSPTAGNDYVLNQQGLTVNLNATPMTLGEFTIQPDFSYVVVYSQPYVATGSMLGDVDGNGSISIIDVRLLLQAYINNSWTAADFPVMDMDGNNTIDILDVRLLLKTYINT